MTALFAIGWLWLQATRLDECLDTCKELEKGCVDACSSKAKDKASYCKPKCAQIGEGCRKDCKKDEGK